MYSPLQVWKFHPDNLESVTWWVFHLKKIAVLRTRVNNKIKTVKSFWVLYDSEDEDWTILENNTITEDWTLVELDELKEIWKEQFTDAQFSMADIEDRKPMVWTYYVPINAGLPGELTYSRNEIDKITDIDEAEIKNAPLKEALFWIFNLNIKVMFHGKNYAYGSNWVVYDVSENKWLSKDDKFIVSDKTCSRVTYDELTSEWDNFFKTKDSESPPPEPPPFNFNDIKEDTS